MITNDHSKSCMVVPPRGGNPATIVANNATTSATSYATIDLKALADKVLLRNKQCNINATEQKIPCNFQGDCEDKKLCGHYHTLSLRELHSYAGDDWQELWKNKAMLEAFAKSIRQTQLFNKGIVPKHYTQTVTCENCGEVKLWAGCPDYVIGCPWCLVSSISDKNRELTGGDYGTV